MALASSVLMFAGSPQAFLGVASVQESLFLLMDILPAYARQLRGELAQTLVELSSFVAGPFTNSGVRFSRSKRPGVISFRHSFRLERILLMARGWQ
jgi:hypothetical protein